MRVTRSHELELMKLESKKDAHCRNHNMKGQK